MSRAVHDHDCKVKSSSNLVTLSTRTHWYERSHNLTSSSPETLESRGGWNSCENESVKCPQPAGGCQESGSVEARDACKGVGTELVCEKSGSTCCCACRFECDKTTSTRKRVRLPPLLMPVTHLVFAFPSRRESLHLFPPLVYSAACPARPNPTESHGNEPDLAEAGYRKSNHQDFVKKSRKRNFLTSVSLETGYWDGSLMCVFLGA